MIQKIQKDLHTIAIVTDEILLHQKVLKLLILATSYIYKQILEYRSMNQFNFFDAHIPFKFWHW